MRKWLRSSRVSPQRNEVAKEFIGINERTEERLRFATTMIANNGQKTHADIAEEQAKQSLLAVGGKTGNLICENAPNHVSFYAAKSVTIEASYAYIFDVQAKKRKANIIRMAKEFDKNGVIEPNRKGWQDNPKALLGIGKVRPRVLEWLNTYENITKGFILVDFLKILVIILKEESEGKIVQVCVRSARRVLTELGWVHRKKKKGPVYYDGHTRPDVDWYLHEVYIPGRKLFNLYMPSYTNAPDGKGLVETKGKTLPAPATLCARGVRISARTTKPSTKMQAMNEMSKLKTQAEREKKPNSVLVKLPLVKPPTSLQMS